MTLLYIIYIVLSRYHVMYNSSGSIVLLQALALVVRCDVVLCALTSAHSVALPSLWPPAVLRMDSDYAEQTLP